MRNWNIERLGKLHYTIRTNENDLKCHIDQLRAITSRHEGGRSNTSKNEIHPSFSVTRTTLPENREQTVEGQGAEEEVPEEDAPGGIGNDNQLAVSVEVPGQLRRSQQDRRSPDRYESYMYN